MERPFFRFAALPSDLSTRICGFVDSADLLALSHVNRHCFHDVLGPNSDVWQSRLPPRAFADNSKWNDVVRKMLSTMSTSPGLNWKAPFRWLKTALARTAVKSEPSYKELYFSSRSLRFLGFPLDRWCYTVIPHQLQIPEKIALGWTKRSFSLDVWFAVLPGTLRLDDTVASGGGILLSSTIALGYMEAQAHSFIEVSDGNLYCSMVQDRPIVAHGLHSRRWYHLALSFEYQGDTGTQHVYLDGRLIHTMVGSLDPAWSNLPTKRIGNGFNTQWMNFCGVVDDFRLWNGVLHPDNVQQILHGRETETSDLVCQWSLKRDGIAELTTGMVTVVRCGRPLENRVYDEDEDVLELWRLRQVRPRVRGGRYPMI